MYIKTLKNSYILSQLFVVVLAAAGQPYFCEIISGTTFKDCQTSCQVPLINGEEGHTPRQCEWWGTTQPACAVADCGCLTQSSSQISQLNDSLCLSCYTQFANSYGNSCVSSAASCNPAIRGTTKWTDSDCAICFGNPILFASIDGSSCVKSTASCSSAIRGTTIKWTDYDCTVCYGSGVNKFATADGSSCDAIPGASVSCAVTGPPFAMCAGCEAYSTTLGHFKVQGFACCVIDCSVDPGTNLNGWMCKSCNGIAKAQAIYSGPLFQANTCVSECTNGTRADSNYICQFYAIPGASVNCGTVVNGGIKTCNGCGASLNIQGLFSVNSIDATCYVTDCTVAPGTNLNGWMCKSCFGIPNAHPAYSAGGVLQGTNCAFSCLVGFTPDSNQICQQNTVSGSDVPCGNVSKTSIYSTNCQGCGVNSDIQNLFTISINPNCKVVDCTKNPGPSLNGWMCKSCKGTTGAHSAYSAGKLLSGNACVAFCPLGQTADANNVCKPGSNSGSIQLISVFTMLLLCLLS